MAEDQRNRRHPQNLQGVLRLAVEAGSAADGPALPEPMSEERKEWLKGALAEVAKGQNSEVEQMKECMRVVLRDGGCERGREGEEEGEDEEGETEGALEFLSELCENLDNARDLMTLGGLDLCMSQCLNHPQGSVRWRGAQLIASCAQNMPEVQCHLLSKGALPKLLQLTDSDPHPTVRVKALYAVSCLVREQEVGLRAFLSHDGFSVLMRGMQSDNEKLRTKSSFLLLNLLTVHPEHKGLCVSVSSLVEDSPLGLRDCQSPTLGLEEMLNQRAEDLQGREECQEEVEFCKRLRSVCFCGRQPDDSGMDR
uniref:HSPA (heat shock 70kDa) binding protein, cytoplasmic cochaperone 1 n=1 Tax=Hucho hucho TaxID=62062 RepID=A0A4W5QS98_9TELE